MKSNNLIRKNSDPEFINRNVIDIKDIMANGSDVSKNIARENPDIFSRFEKFIAEKQFRDPGIFNAFMQEFRLQIAQCEQVFPRTEILPSLKKIRKACTQSPFINRAQQWPRGYPGDFETVEYIMQSKNKAKTGSFGYVIEDFLLNSPICQQHRNKVSYQADLIRQAIDRNPAAKIISIGCGTSEDVRRCIPEIQNSHASITLVDVDADAIAFSMQRLKTIKERVTTIIGNIYRVMRSLTDEYDLILIGGVFDYLNDKTIIAVLSSLRINLVENGILFFTNIARNNPYRIFMEYLSDWILIERDETDLVSLIQTAAWQDHDCKLLRDETGLTHLIELRA